MQFSPIGEFFRHTIQAIHTGHIRMIGDHSDINDKVSDDPHRT